MIEIIGIRFRSAGKIYYFAPNGITAEPGQRVIVQTVRGTEIGTVGNTGQSTGPHLHLELRKDGQPVNPADYWPEN